MSGNPPGAAVDSRSLATSRPAAPAANLLAAPIRHARVVAGAVLVLAALSPQSPPVATGLVDPESYASVWSQRVGPANLVEIGLVAAFAVALVRRIGLPSVKPQVTALDRLSVVGVAVICVAQALAMLRGLPDLQYLGVDVERVGLAIGGYLLVRLFFSDVDALIGVLKVVAAVLAIRTVELVAVHGIIQGTQFGTASGRRALLITEDSLLILLPVLLAWGSMVDGRLSRRSSVAATTGVVLALIVNLLSLRRGALLVMVGALALRTVRVSRRVLALTAACALALGAVLYAAGPLRSVVGGAVYTLESAVGLEEDNSTSQRQAELTNFGANVDGVDWFLGRGLGTKWNADVSGAIEIGSFGSAETAYVRIGWHFYGLDYLYKFGAFGCAALIGLLLAMLARARGAHRLASPRESGFVWSLALCLPCFALFAFTNARVAFFAGVVAGALAVLVAAAQSHTSERA